MNTQKRTDSTLNETQTSQIGSGSTTSGTPESIWDKQARAKREYRQKREVRDREREYYAANADSKKASSRNYYERTKTDRSIKSARPFIGVDGEGINLENGYHAYNMLRAGDYTLSPRSGDVRLRTTDCLEFLSQLPPNYIYVAFFFDYDVAKILEDLPYARLKYLIDKEGRRRKRGGFWPVDYQGYSIDYLPRKEFKVRKGDGPWVTIHDVGSFFQTSFVSALNLWGIGTEEQRSDIADGKSLRAEFATIDPEYIDRYNSLECVLLAELMSKFRAACIEVGYVPKKWQGPGLLAEAMLEKNGIIPTKDIPLFDEVEEDSVAMFARNAFYGGRFETSIVGYTDWPDGREYKWKGCVQYDINSAYPAALQHVPCLVHGVWRREIGPRKLAVGELSLVFGGFRPINTKVMFYGLPIRKFDGSIHFPQNGKGWYWSFEVESAIHQDFTVYDSWVYENHCDCKPFAFLEDLYRARKAMGKAAKGIVLKLAMNSVYGKMAQSIGEPKYSNPIWASFITAYTRTKIMSTIHTMPGCKTGWCGKDVFMIATDAFFTYNYDSDTWSLECSNELGEWDRTGYPSGLFIIQPGMYFDPDSSEAKFKTRGVPRNMVVEHKEKFLVAFANMRRTHRISDGDVLLPMTLFVGIRQALHRGTRNFRKLLGQFIPYKDPITGNPGRRTSFDWTTKRRPQPWPEFDGALSSMEQPHIITAPYIGTTGEDPTNRPIQTLPYSKDIGGLQKRDQLRLEFADQPDWLPEP